MNKNIERGVATAFSVQRLGFDPMTATDDELAQLSEVINDVMLDEPETELGKSIKLDVTEELLKENSEMVENSKYIEDIRMNKTLPILKILTNSISTEMMKLETFDIPDEAIDAIADQFIGNADTVGLSTGYYDNVLTILNNAITRIKRVIDSQVEVSQDKLLSVVTGVRHPKFNTLDIRHATLAQIREAITKVMEEKNLKEEDYR